MTDSTEKYVIDVDWGKALNPERRVVLRPTPESADTLFVLELEKENG